MKYILLSGKRGKGIKVTVDDEDFEELNKHRWHLSYYGYARTGINHEKVMMHRLILGAKKGQLVDHTNRDTLDNRKTNIMICTKKQNQTNQKLRIDNTSGYKGVSWHKISSKWKAEISHLGEGIHLGLFRTKKDAAKAYNEAVFKYHDKYAYLNQI